MTDTTPILAIILCGVTLLALALLLLWPVSYTHLTLPTT